MEFVQTERHKLNSMEQKEKKSCIILKNSQLSSVY